MFNNNYNHNHTSRRFSRTLTEAFPDQYMNKNVIEGPFYSAPHISDFSVLMGIIAAFSFCGFIMWNYL